MKIESIIEAIIFVADSPLKPEQLLEILSHSDYEGEMPDREGLLAIMDAIEEKFKISDDYSFELRKIDGGYQFFTKREYYSYVRHAVAVTSRKKLSRSNLETLAIVAYRQPVTKPEIEYIRGVNCDHAIQKLLEKKLIEIRGREKAPGQPLLYGISSYFMEFFGINEISDLPKLQEFSIDEDEYRKHFETFLREQEPENVLTENGNGEEHQAEPIKIQTETETEEGGIVEEEGGTADTITNSEEE